MDKVVLMKGVAAKLFASEAAIDVAISDTAALVSQMIEARTAAKVSTTVDAKVHAKVAEAMMAMATARSAMAEAHAEMNEVKLRLGVRTRMDGINVHKTGADLDQVEAHLRLVNEG